MFPNYDGYYFNQQAYDLAKNCPGTIITDLPIVNAKELGLEEDSKVLLLLNFQSRFK